MKQITIPKLFLEDEYEEKYCCDNIGHLNETHLFIKYRNININ